MNRVKKELMDNLNIIILSDHVESLGHSSEPNGIVLFQGMSDIRKVVGPIADGFVDPSLMERNPMYGALYSVFSLPGKVTDCSPH